VAVVAAVLAAALLAASGPAGGAASPDPTGARLGTFALSSTTPNPGDTIRIDGTGWPPGSNLKLEVCGNNALDGTVDCDQPASRIARTFTSGVLEAELVVPVPPKPCPCVVRITELEGRTSVTQPVAIQGVATAPTKSDAPLSRLRPTLRVRASVESATDIGSLFGGAASRTLVVHVRNTGENVVDDALLSASWGKGDDPNHVIPSRTLAQIRPGEARTVRVPFAVDALSAGGYTVAGSVGVVGNRPAFSTTTTQHPLGLYAVVLLLVVSFGLLVRRAVRRRRARRAAEALAAEKAARAAKNGSGKHTKRDSPKAKRARKARRAHESRAEPASESELVP
jgi:hypothetical protein